MLCTQDSAHLCALVFANRMYETGARNLDGTQGFYHPEFPDKSDIRRDLLSPQVEREVQGLGNYRFVRLALRGKLLGTVSMVSTRQCLEMRKFTVRV